MNNKIVKIKIKGILPTENGFVIFLGTETKTFFICIDSIIGQTIIKIIKNENENFQQILSYNLILSILKGINGAIAKIIINDIRQEIFYSSIFVEIKDRLVRKILEVEADIINAIIISIINKLPLYINQNILDSTKDVSDILKKIIKKENR